MRRLLGKAMVSCAALCFAPADALAQSTVQEETTADLRAPGAPSLSPAVFPVEQVLEALRSSFGYSFIFDSRLIKGKSIKGLNAGNPERALDTALSDINLSLRRIAPKTFAIAARSEDEPDIAKIQTPQYAPVQPADAIIVTGTFAKGNSEPGSSRIFSIDADEIAFLNITSTAEAIYDLPQALASITPANTVLFGSALGLSLADLRGLAPKRTLVLVNGRKRALSPGGNFDIGGVDLASVSETFIERIEVDNSPAGARFADSAVAGAVNFVTRTNVDGLQLGLQSGISERGDSETVSVHAIGGASLGGRSRLTAGFNIRRIEGLIGADREFSAVPYGLALNGLQSDQPDAVLTPGFGGSPITDDGAFVGALLSDGTKPIFPTPLVYEGGGSVTPFIGAQDQYYNWSAWQTLTSPSDRLYGLVSFETQIGENFTFSVDAQGAAISSAGQLAPSPAGYFRGLNILTGDAAVIPIDNPFLPQSIVDLARNQFGNDVSALLFEYRFSEIGPRRSEVNRRFVDVTAEFGYSNDRGVNSSFYYRYGLSRSHTTDFDRVDLNKVASALDVGECAATPGCSPLDFFSAAGISQAALDFITIPEFDRRLVVAQHEIGAAVGAEIELDESRTLKGSLGVEYLSESYSDRYSLDRDVLPVAFIGGAETKRSMQTIETYAKINIPIARSQYFLHGADVSLAVRAANTSYTDLVTNFESAADIEPIAGLTLFTRQTLGERSPNLFERFSSTSPLKTRFLDPCASPEALLDPVIQENCMSAGPYGVPAGFRQTATHASTAIVASPYLDTEDVRSQTYGLTILPGEFFDWRNNRMELSAAWRKIRIRNAIIGVNNAIWRCYSSIDLSSPSCAADPETGRLPINRDPSTRQVLSIENRIQNVGEMSWEGFDVEFRHSMSPSWPLIDEVWVSALHTMTTRVSMDNGFDKEMRLDGLIDYPRHRTLASVGVDIGRLSLGATLNRRGKAATQRLERSDVTIPAESYIDLSGRFNFSDVGYIQFGVQNLLDNEPQIVAFNEGGNFAPEHYDPVGRSFRLSIQTDF